MNKNMVKLFYLVVILAFMLSCTPLYVQGGIEDIAKKTYEVKGGGTLILDTDIGSIEVKSKEVNTVNIEVNMITGTYNQERAKRIINDFRLEFNRQGNEIFVRGDYKHHNRWFSWFKRRRLKVRFLITVPPVFDVDLKTSGGSISVSNLDGEVKSRTSGGSLNFGMIKGPLYGRTSGGSIRLKGCQGDVDVKTSGGSIVVGKITGDVYARTSGGGIRVEEVSGSIKAATSGGSIRASILKQPEADCHLATSGGSITVYLVEGVKLDVNARTSGGRVRIDFPVTIQGGIISRRKLQGKVNGGGPGLYLRTSGGSINIRQL